ncbi:MAG: OB-fold domain-containing protein, partial [Syntrophobacteraceae bacterium]
NSYYAQVKKPPYVMALVRLDGTDCGLSHFIGGIDVSSIEKVREKIHIGTRVKVKWREEKNADIYDIAYFEPAG